jgi:hypothetical protein
VHCTGVSVCGLWFGNFILIFYGLFGKEEEMDEAVACMEEKKNTCWALVGKLK